LPTKELALTKPLPKNLSNWSWKRRLRRIRKKGFSYLCHRIWFRLYTSYREHQLGVSTKGFIPWFELYDEEENHDYDATSYAMLDQVMGYVQETVSDPIFIDYGAGKGRTMLVAGTYQFKKVFGIEFSEKLVAEARINLKNSTRKLKCPQVEIVHENAMTWDFPDDANVVFMFNPFSGHVMDSVLHLIKKSLENHPRELKLIYIYPVKNVENPLVDLNWLQEEKEFDTGAEDHSRCLIYTQQHSSI